MRAAFELPASVAVTPSPTVIVYIKFIKYMIALSFCAWISCIVYIKIHQILSFSVPNCHVMFDLTLFVFPPHFLRPILLHFVHIVVLLYILLHILLHIFCLGFHCCFWKTHDCVCVRVCDCKV